jgi:hypothetical protein
MILSAALALRWTEFFLAIGALISSSELLQIHRSLRSKNLLSWRINRLAHPSITRVIEKLGVEGVFGYPGILGILAIRAGAALVTIATFFASESSVIPLVVLSITTLIFTFRSSESNDGSDQMGSIAVLACTLTEISGTQAGKCIGLTFIAFQASLAYGTSGFLKAGAKGWRDGTFVLDILRTSSFGNKHVLGFLKNKLLLVTLLGCGVAYGDCGLSVAMFLPPPVCITTLACGVMLHVGIAFVLGLNTFLWSFVATYPALLWISSVVWSRI